LPAGQFCRSTSLFADAIKRPYYGKWLAGHRWEQREAT